MVRVERNFFNCKPWIVRNNNERQIVSLSNQVAINDVYFHCSMFEEPKGVAVGNQVFSDEDALDKNSIIFPSEAKIGYSAFIYLTYIKGEPVFVAIIDPGPRQRLQPINHCDYLLCFRDKTALAGWVQKPSFFGD